MKAYGKPATSGRGGFSNYNSGILDKPELQELIDELSPAA